MFRETKVKALIYASIIAIIGAVTLIAQGSGKPSQLIVKTDSNGYLKVASATYASPDTSTTFSNTRLRTDSSGNLLITDGGSGGGFAPANATYITQTANSTLTNEQALSTLSTGLMNVTTSTGVVTSVADVAAGSVLTSGTPSAWSTALPAGITVNQGSGSATATVNGILTTSTTQACNIANTNEQDLFTYTLPANTLSANGKGVEVYAWGTKAANTNSVTFRPYFSGNLGGFTTTSNGAPWFTHYIILRTGASAQKGLVENVVNGASPGIQGATTASGNTANAITIKITGQAAAGTANDICFEGAIVRTIG